MRLFSRQNPEASRRRQAALSRTPASSSDSRQDYTFRRGRTLTGSASPVVYSTNETGADLKSPRVHAHMLARQRRRIGSLFMVALAATTILFILVGQFTADVEVQATPDTSMQLDGSYEKVISDYLSDHPVERFRFFMNEARLSDFVRAELPEVKMVTQKGGAGFGASLYAIGVRAPIASWSISGKQLYVDEDGVPFSRNYFSSPNLTVTDRSGVPVTPGKSVASNRFMGFVGQVIGRAKAKGYIVTGIVIPPGMTRQIEVRVDGVGYPVKFSSDRQVGEEIEDMGRAIGWMKARKLSPEYIDVRVKGKVFYH